MYFHVCVYLCLWMCGCVCVCLCVCVCVYVCACGGVYTCTFHRAHTKLIIDHNITIATGKRSLLTGRSYLATYSE